MSLPLVSVVIPCFNARPWIEETLASVKAQTHRNLEIIVVDDGSTDGSAEWLDEAGRRNVIQVIHQENRGAAAARNAGLSRASGEFIQLLDADDILACEEILDRRIHLDAGFLPEQVGHRISLPFSR